jgi:hypothetical protein
LLPAFSAQISFAASNKSELVSASSACIHSEITPQLRDDVRAAVRYGPIAVFLLVFLSGLLATLFPPAVPATRRPSGEAPGNEDHHRIISSSQLGVVQRTILPGVSDCLLHLQFIFFMGALTLRYPGFYQPFTSLFHWSALFSPVGPLSAHRRYPSVNDGIYEINGTLTGSYGLELMSQITGGPMTMDVWWNMVVIAGIITAVVAMFMLAHRVVASLSFSMPAESGGNGQSPDSDSPIARGTWNVLRVVLSYFLTPIVAISTYQLDNVFLPAYHLALATLLVVLMLIGLTWMWRIAPSNQLGVLLLDSSKRYRRVSTDDPDDSSSMGQRSENQDMFAIIFLALAFARGVAVGGFQFSPLAQVVALAAIELALLVSTAILRPMNRRILSVFTWSGIARLAVVALTAVFLPELKASISVRSRVAIVILAIHAAVLVLGCAVPATIRLASLVFTSSWTPADEPEVSCANRACSPAHTNRPLVLQIYGLSQLRRRSDAVNNLSSVPPSSTPGSISNSTRADSLASQGHSPRSPSNGSSIGFYLDQHSSPDALYLRAIPQHHYFRPPRSSSSTRRSDLPHSSSANSPPRSSTSPRTSDSDSSPRQGGEGSPTSTTPALTARPAKPQRSCTSSSEGTVLDPSEPSLFPQQRPDYAVREADLYYGHGRPQRAGTFGDAAGLADAAGAQQAQRQGSAVSRVMANVREQWTGRRSGSVERGKGQKGFEVRRTARGGGGGG